MAKLPGSFNHEEHDDYGSYEPLPLNWYPVMITESDYKENSKQTGHNISLKLEVVDGDLKGRAFYDNLAIDNPSKKAEEIAGKKLASYCRAVGVPPGLEETEDLHDTEFYVKAGPSGENTEVKEIVSVEKFKEEKLGDQDLSKDEKKSSSSKPKEKRKRMWD